MSCLSALAAKPERIYKLFKTKTVNAAGCYVLSLCVNGTWQEVIVDDYLPTHYGKIVFGDAHPTVDGKRVLWVSLLEKAWSKLNGNYDRTIMGTLDMGFIHLCGVPSVDMNHL
jgi:calpain-15